MKKIFSILIAGLLLAGCRESGEGHIQNNADVRQVIAELYTNEEGFIHAYPNKRDSDYLSESIGLYMQYLVEADEAGAFAEQVGQLTGGFIAEEPEGPFIRWMLYENSNVNALIDDVRIIHALNQGAGKFDEPAYRELADRLSSVIAHRQQRDGHTVDYYDWSIGLPAQRITLSYLIDDPSGTIKGQEFLENIDETEVFFPEYYDYRISSYVKSREVHMIDQLLIAINRIDSGFSSERFTEWIRAEWKAEGKLFGRYARESLKATVSYESLAVYYYLHAYFERVGEKKLAEGVLTHVQSAVRNHEDSDLHFFDYIHYQLLLQKTDG